MAKGRVVQSGTVNPRRAGKTRRWQPAAAFVATLGLFVALVAGSALRPQFAAAALPEPVAWSHAAPGAGGHAEHVQRHGRSQLTSPAAGSSWGAAPINKKPFHSTWMTQDRPQTWMRWSEQSVRSPLPASFAMSVFAPDSARNRSPAYLPDGQDILTQLCVTRC